MRMTSLALALCAGLAACAAPSTLPEAAATGPDPALPAPDARLIPTVNIAPATGWPADAAPTPANGLAVTRFAEGLQHPRWLHVLPNGDVLVAETNSPPREGGGFTGWVMNLLIGAAGAGEASANRVTSRSPTHFVADT